MRIEDAIEVFGAGFSFNRNWAHPFLFEQVGPLWWFHDAPRKRPPYRSEEWLVFRTDAVEAHALIQSTCQGRYRVCVFRTTDESEEPIRTEWKSLEYRLHGTEKLFAHPLNFIQEVECAYQIEQVQDHALADRLTAENRGHKQILPVHLAAVPPRYRVWVALDGDQIVGQVRSLLTGQSGWCSNMFVRPSHRRRGIAKALLSRMLASDKALGAESAVLLASHAGAMLYPHLGYEEIGELLMFTPTNAIPR